MDSDNEENQNILKCLKNLLNIRAGTQPMDRELGINWDCLDQLPEVAETLFMVELEDKVEKYEPRAQVKQVTFELSENGMEPYIIFTRKEG